METKMCLSGLEASQTSIFLRTIKSEVKTEFPIVSPSSFPKLIDINNLWNEDMDYEYYLTPADGMSRLETLIKDKRHVKTLEKQHIEISHNIIMHWEL